MATRVMDISQCVGTLTQHAASAIADQPDLPEVNHGAQLTVAQLIAALLRVPGSSPVYLSREDGGYRKVTTAWACTFGVTADGAYWLRLDAAPARRGERLTNAVIIG